MDPKDSRAGAPPVEDRSTVKKTIRKVWNSTGNLRQAVLPKKFKPSEGKSQPEPIPPLRRTAVSPETASPKAAIPPLPLAAPPPVQQNILSREDLEKAFHWQTPSQPTPTSLPPPPRRSRTDPGPKTDTVRLDADVTKTEPPSQGFVLARGSWQETLGKTPGDVKETLALGKSNSESVESVESEPEGLTMVVATTWATRNSIRRGQATCRKSLSLRMRLVH
ncbi:hypothetical protein FA95DRAFT_1567172 [Auriscalpium vulgare]|uniref:Uncharacterized protein n=1 Tax=Auriscalpium vulgare TaxID=40419 RepID=A0ACB8R667_9AGAM|nr:hypothetical protein FA95DRAFT_1567172 [Auriscalpium vulgare]